METSVYFTPAAAELEHAKRVLREVARLCESELESPSLERAAREALLYIRDLVRRGRESSRSGRAHEPHPRDIMEVMQR